MRWVLPLILVALIHRTPMLPERTEFPVHDLLHRLAPKRIFNLAAGVH